MHAPKKTFPKFPGQLPFGATITILKHVGLIPTGRGTSHKPAINHANHLPAYFNAEINDKLKAKSAKREAIAQKQRTEKTI